LDAAVYVSRLRRTLGHDDVIATRSGGYRLVAAAEAIDAVRFERLAVRARARRSAGDVDGAAADLDEALRLRAPGPLQSARYLELFAMLCIRLAHSPTAGGTLTRARPTPRTWPSPADPLPPELGRPITVFDFVGSAATRDDRERRLASSSESVQTFASKAVRKPLQRRMRVVEPPSPG
jgi:hypothetical protein